MGKVLKVIGIIFLGIIIIFVCLAIWSTYQTKQYTNSATPYLQENLPKVLSWQYKKFEPLLTTEAKEFFDAEKGQKVYGFLSRLGRLETLGEIQFLGSQTGLTTSEGSSSLVRFSILATFKTGEAQVLIHLVPNDESFLIHYMKINSDVFLQ